MEKSLIPSHCLNCNSPVQGEYCQHCGQSIRDNSDRSLTRLLGEVFGNFFFLDNRILVSLKHLFAFPGRMTVEFIEGKRKKFISPITLFLFFNLIYFFVNPLTDYSLPLYDQITAQPIYSEWAKDWTILKLKANDLDFQDYSLIYQDMSDNISKSIMIINVPIIAIFIFLMSFKKRKFYYDSLIFSFHFFSLYIASWIIAEWITSLIDLIYGYEDSDLSSIVFMFLAFVGPSLYGIFSMRKLLIIPWYWAIPAGLGTMVAVTLANMIYRLIVFTVTMWAT